MDHRNKLFSNKKKNRSRDKTNNLKSLSKSRQKIRVRSNSKNHEKSNRSSKEKCSHLKNESKVDKIHKKRREQDSGLCEYYQVKKKSTSKNKLEKSTINQEKNKFITNIYMHKDKNAKNIISQLQPFSNVEQNKKQDQCNQYLKNNKIFEKSGAIDHNGRYVVKQKRKNVDSSNLIDSFQTLIQNEKKDKKKKKVIKEKESVIKIKSKKQRKISMKILTVKSIEKVKHLRSVEKPIESILQSHKYSNQSQKNRFVRGRENPLLSNRTSKTFLSDETQTSPKFLAEVLPLISPQIYIEDLIEKIQLEKRNLDSSKLKAIYSGDLRLERVRGIQFMSKISQKMSIRRQAHSLGIYYMDKYMQGLNKEVNLKEFRLICLSSFLLAVKMEDGIMSRRLAHEYINHMESMLNIFSKTSVKSSKSISKSRKDSSYFSSKESSLTLNKSKSQTQIQLNSYELDKLQQHAEKKRSEKKPQQMSIILETQLKMLIKFNFKLAERTNTYWMDTFTFLWDDYIDEQVSWEDELFFRNQYCKKNISWCYQLLDKLVLDPTVYEYSTPALTLSIIYIVVRIKMDSLKNNSHVNSLSQKYAANLNKSSNFIFYDKIGVNQLFGSFLEQFKMSLSSLIDCIQFVGKNLTSTFKTFNFNSKYKRINQKSFQHQLSIYEPNMQIFKTYQLKRE